MLTVTCIGAAASPVKEGSDLKGSFKFDGLERTFHLHIPPDFERQEKLPLIIALHGRGGNGESMVLLTRQGFNRLSDSDRFIMAYPNGIGRNWNDGRMDEEANDRAHRDNIDDVGFISALIDSLIKDYNADPGRIYITGISNGAIMSYRLGCELSQKITAIAPVDGNIPVMLFQTCSPALPVSVLAINNVNDPLVPYYGGDIISAFQKINLGKVLSADESVRFWVNRDECAEVPLVTPEPDTDPGDGTRVTKKEYVNGIGQTEVVFYIIDGGGHTWPGGFQYLPAWIIGKTCRDIDATRVIWTFFRKHSR